MIGELRFGSEPDDILDVHTFDDNQPLAPTSFLFVLTPFSSIERKPTMTTLPTHPPPPPLTPSALPHLVSHISTALPSGPRALLPPLTLALRTLALARLSPSPPPTPPLAPLHAFTSLASEDPSEVSVSLLADALLAYPAEVGALGGALVALLSLREGELAEMVRSAPSLLSSSPAPEKLLATTRLIHALLRLPGSHIVLAHGRELVPALVAAYDAVGAAGAGEGQGAQGASQGAGSADADARRQILRAKAETLVLLRALFAADGSLRPLLPPARTGTPLVDQNATADMAVFASTSVRGEVAEALRALHDDERRDDPVSGLPSSVSLSSPALTPNDPFPLPCICTDGSASHPSCSSSPPSRHTCSPTPSPTRPSVRLHAAGRPRNKPRRSSTQSSRVHFPPTLPNCAPPQPRWTAAVLSRPPQHNRMRQSRSRQAHHDGADGKTSTSPRSGSRASEFLHSLSTVFVRN